MASCRGVLRGMMEVTKEIKNKNVNYNTTSLLFISLIPWIFKQYAQILNDNVSALADVVAISLSEFASKTDEIFRCKKHTILLTISGYICNKSTNKDTSQHASTNNITGIHYNNLRPQMGASLCVLLHTLKVRSGEVHCSNQ